MAITAASTVEKVREKFPQAIVETVEFRGEQTIILQPEQLVAVCTYLQKNLQYTFLSSITAVHWPERLPRFDVVYHLLSIPHRSELRLKVRVGAKREEHPSVPTVDSPREQTPAGPAGGKDFHVAVEIRLGDIHIPGGDRHIRVALRQLLHTFGLE